MLLSFMSEKKDPTRDADPGPERIDPRSGLARLKEAMRHILKVPNDVLAKPSNTFDSARK